MKTHGVAIFVVASMVTLVASMPLVARCKYTHPPSVLKNNNMITRIIVNGFQKRDDILSSIGLGTLGPVGGVAQAASNVVQSAVGVAGGIAGDAINIPLDAVKTLLGRNDEETRDEE